MKPFLIITGMHRSGTSFLIRALNLRGIYLGKFQDLVSDDWLPYQDNLRGHWEHRKVVELNENTLEYSGGSWDNIPVKIQINETIRKETKDFITELLNYKSLGAGIKDPRFLLSSEMWLPFLPKDFLVVGIYREPLKVAESLKKRNGFNYAKSIKLWKIYNQKLLQLLEKNNGFLLNFDWEKEKLFDEIDLICNKLALPTSLKLDEWYTPSLMQSDRSYDSNYKIDEDTKLILSKLNNKAQQNENVSVKKIIRSEEELMDTIINYLIQLQKQGIYFKRVNDENLKKIKKLQKLIDEIHESVTWKLLQKIDNIKKKLHMT